MTSPHLYAHSARKTRYGHAICVVVFSLCVMCFSVIACRLFTAPTYAQSPAAKQFNEQRFDPRGIDLQRLEKQQWIKRGDNPFKRIDQYNFDAFSTFDLTAYENINRIATSSTGVWQIGATLAQKHPLIRTNEDAALLFAGKPLALLDRTKPCLTCQVVTEVPSTLPDSPFGQLGGGTAAEIAAARERIKFINDEMADCTPKAVAVLDAQVEMINATPQQMKEIKQRYAEVLKDYALSCFANAASIPKEVKAVTGILALSGAPFCSATIISKTEIISARHCFLNKDMNGPDQEHGAALIEQRVIFMPYDPLQQNKKYTVVLKNSNDLTPSSTVNVANDQLTLQIAIGEFPNYAVPATNTISKATLFTELWIVANNVIPAIGDITIGNANNYMWAALPPICAIIRIGTDGCAYHTCQTSPSSSGAGLLQLRDGKVKLIGVHHGASSQATTCSDTSLKDKALNIASLLRP